eukprot:Phypoly_transcript_09206.p1 GENE.Phypoly_transcript_09206~~Phypoly_transcript_09206.p1  ORF type:complete len:357 (+),score=102.07 Phypoly_transcript_09206:159-1229(+)
MSAATVIETYIQTVTLQPPFAKYDAVPDLQTYQENSKKTAEHWITAVRTNIARNNADLLGFAQRIHTLHDNLDKSAKSVENAQSKQSFDEGVATLRKDLETKAENVQNVVEALSVWHDQLHQDYQQKLRHKATIASHIATLNGKIAALTPALIETPDPNAENSAPSDQVASMESVQSATINEQDTTQSEQSTQSTSQNNQITAQTTSQSDQVAETTTQNKPTAQSDQATTQSDPETQVVQAGAQTEVRPPTEEEIAARNAEIESLNAEIAHLQDLDNTLTPLILNCIYALRAVNTMLQQWQHLRINIKHLQDSVVQLPGIPQAWLSAELEDSKSKWKAVLKNAQDINKQLQITTLN